MTPHTRIGASARLREAPLLLCQSLATVLILTMAVCVHGQVPGTQRWRINVGGEMNTPAIAKDGSLCFCTAAGYFFCISTNGTTNWMRQVAGYLGTAPSGSPPAIAADGTIYFGTGTGQFYSFTGDGFTNWCVTPITSAGNAPSLRCAPAIASDGTVYVSFGTSTSSVLVALSPAGTTNWSFPLASPHFGVAQFSSPTIGRDGTIYIGTYAGLLYSIHPDGTKNWVYNVQHPIYSSPTIGPDESIYVSGDGGSMLYSLDRFGRLKWKTLYGGENEASAVIGTNGWVYIGSLSGRFGAFDPATGSNIWYALIGLSGSSAIAADGTVYAVTWNQNLAYRFSPTGSNIWSFYLPGSSFTSPIIASDGTLYLTSGSQLISINGTNAPAATSWPMYRRDMRRQARSTQCSLDSAAVGPDGSALLSLRTEPGLNYALLGATDLANWTTVMQLTSGSPAMLVRDYSASNYTGRFYRLMSR